MDFTMYIRPSAFILVPALYFIGLFLKQTPFIPKWSHVWIQLAIAIISCLTYYGVEIQSVIQGILVTGVTVISRDLIHNTLDGITEAKEKKKNGDNDSEKKNE